MPLSASKNVWNTLFVIGVVVSLAFFLMFYFSDISVVIILGLCIIIIVEKLGKIYNKVTASLSERMRNITLILIIGFVVLFILSYISRIYSGFSYIVMNLVYFEQLIQAGTRTINDLIESSYFSPFLTDSIKAQINNTITKASAKIIVYAGNIISDAALLCFYAILIFPIMFYYYFKRRDNVNLYLQKIVPDEINESFFKAYHAIIDDINNYFNGKVIQTIAVGVMSAVGYYIIGLDNWLILGMIVGIMNNIPYIGPWIGAAPAFIVGMAISPFTGIYIIIINAIAQFVDSAYLTPIVVSDQVSVNPFLSVVLTMAFAQEFGALGMILAVPIYSIFRIIIKESYKQLILFYPSEDDKKDIDKSKEAAEEIKKDGGILKLIKNAIQYCV